MSRAIKTVSTIRAEGRSHRTKAELALRERSEEAMLTGCPIKESEEIEGNPVAHEEFSRLMTIMTQIGKNDELFGAPCRRYCLITAELHELNQTMREMEQFKANATDAREYKRIQDTILRMEKLAIVLRNQLSEFESQNGMTIAASLRLIPKRPEKTTDPLMDILNS